MNTPPHSIAPLIAGAKAGDRSAIERLLSRYRPFLRILAEQEIGPALGRRYDGSDVAQQTCLEAVCAFAEFAGTTEPELTAWLRQIMRRNVANLIRDNRAKKRDVRRESPLYGQDTSAQLVWVDPQAHDTSPSQNLIRGENALDLAAAIEKLSDDQRVAVTMRYLEGKPLAEVAEQLGRTNSAVAGLIHRGIKTLRSNLELP